MAGILAYFAPRSDTVRRRSDSNSSATSEEDHDDLVDSSDDSIPGDAMLMSEPSAKRSKHRKSGFNKKWLTDFPWVIKDTGGKGMLCSLCRKHSRRPKKSVTGRCAWVDVPCVTLTRNTLSKHELSEAHCDAVKLETQLCLSKKDGGIAGAFSAVQSSERRAMIGAFKCMYWLCAEQIAHTTNFTSLIALAKSLGATYLNDLCIGKNAQYTSERFIQEVVTCLGDVLSDGIFEEVRASPFFSLMTDETTDVAVVKEVVIYVRYLDQQRQIRTAFVGTVEACNGEANTIKNILTEFCLDNNLDLEHKFVAFGSDGAPVMIGRHNGVAALLKRVVPWLIANHCVCHRLALASAQAADEISYLKEFKAVLGQLYRFYSYSAVRTSGLKEIQDILNDPRLKLTEAKDVRWLSHEKAVSNLRRCLPSVITSLEREASERHDAQALGLATFVRKYKFVATLLMLSDILPPLAALSRALQREDLDYSLVQPLLIGTIATLKNLKCTPGEHFNSLDTMIQDNLKDFNIRLSPHDQRFRVSIYEKYIDAVVRHLEQRFPDVHLLEAFTLFDGKSWPEDPTLLNEFGFEYLVVLTEHFSLLLDGNDKVNSEWNVFKHSTVADNALKIRSMSPHQMMIALTETDSLSTLFPNMFKLALIGLLIPASTADCERGFSALKRIKTPLRNRLSNKIINRLLFIAIEGKAMEEYDFDAACDMWGAKRNRRISVSK